MTDHDLLIRIDERVGGIVLRLDNHGQRIEALEFKKPSEGGGFIFRMIDFFAELPTIAHLLITGSMAVFGAVALIVAYVKRHQ
jgi:hypothetical protein